MRNGVSPGLRVLGLAAVLFVLLAVAAQVTGVARAGPAGGEAGGRKTEPAALAALALLLFCVLVSAVLSWMVVRSTLSGARLAAAVFLAYFGLGTALFQIESAVFLPRHLPPGFVPRLFAMGAFIALFFAPVAVWIHGRLLTGPLAETSAPRLTARAWASRLGALAAVYVALYFLAGYFIAYRNPELVAYYDDVNAGSFGAGMARVWAGTPWLFGLQFLRGLLWIACVLPFVVSFRGRPWELPLLIGCAFSVWALMLLAPNPFMPQSVRLTHLVETGSSNFVFGCLVGAAFARYGVPAPRARSRPAA